VRYVGGELLDLLRTRTRGARSCFERQDQVTNSVGGLAAGSRRLRFDPRDPRAPSAPPPAPGSVRVPP
jgi:hypothetical protein